MLLLLLACNGDAVAPRHTVAPDVTITAPLPNAEVMATEAVKAAAMSDDDGGPENLIVSWTLDSAPLCADPPDVTGYLECVFTPELGEHVLRVEVTDGDELVTGSEIGLTAVEHVIASATINTPTELEVYAPGEEVAFNASIAGMPTMFATWSSSEDGFLGQASVEEGSTDIDDLFALSRGTHLLTFSLTAADGGKATDTVTVLVDAPPDIPTVEISPNSPRTGDALTARVSSSDDDDDALTFAYTWTKNGQFYSNETSVPAGVVAHFEEWGCDVTANDGYTSSRAGTANVRVVNSPPVVDDVLIELTDVFTCTPTASDYDNDPILFQYEWSVDGVVLGTDSVLTDSIASGTAVFCEVTPNDGYEIGIGQVGSYSVGNHPPVASAVFIGPNPAFTTSTLSASATTSDDDGDTVSVSFAWTIDGVAAAGTDVLTDPVARGNVVAVSATPSDGKVSGASISTTITVANSVPSVALALSPASPIAGVDDLICVATTSDPDGDALSTSISWTVNAGPWTGATGTTTLTGDTIPAADLGAGDSWSCTLTADDGLDITSASSAVVTIGS
ncbi:hypothetical protein LBMAG42_37980 [Deltaproteobacteria bacterium]|nr:hypothetical protein LBMAG42_37980 [Deltaproteobacteria bacterium]